MNFYIIIIIQMHIILSFVWHGHDLWSMVYGLWSMVYGLWSMVYGLWSMVYGLWSMVYGLWSMVYGLWSMTMVYGHGHSQQNLIYYVHFNYNIEIHLVR